MTASVPWGNLAPRAHKTCKDRAFGTPCYVAGNRRTIIRPSCPEASSRCRRRNCLTTMTVDAVPGWLMFPGANLAVGANAWPSAARPVPNGLRPWRPAALRTLRLRPSCASGRVWPSSGPRWPRPPPRPRRRPSCARPRSRTSRRGCWRPGRPPPSRPWPPWRPSRRRPRPVLIARLRRVHRGLECRHQVDELAALLGLLDLDGLLALDLGLDDGLEGFAVLVLVLRRVELAGHRGHELLGHLQLGRLEVVILVTEVELRNGADLIGPVKGGQKHRVGERVERGQRLAVLDDHLADRGEPLLLEDGLQKVERLPADLVGLDVVGGLDEADRGVVTFGLRELLDLDGADGLERDALEVLVGDHHVLPGGVLVPLDRVRARDDLVLDWTEDLHLDPGQVFLVEHVETDALGFGRQIELDRDGHQSELDGALPHRTRHADPFRGSAFAGGTRTHRHGRSP